MKLTQHPAAVLLVPVLTVALVSNLASCGTIIYPDRSGQKAGQIDPLVAVLDGFGLLFFFIPGVIAFAVDFSNHSIYLPHGHAPRHRESHQYSQQPLNGKIERADIERMVRAETGMQISLQQSNLQVVRLQSVADLDAQFAAYDHGALMALAP
jgi:hypothetical protein